MFNGGKAIYLEDGRLYSERSTHGEVIKQIAAREPGDVFCSSSYALDTGNEFDLHEYLKAEKEQEGESWRVSLYADKEIVDGAGKVKQLTEIKDIATSLCFVDALHICAHFDKVQRSLMRQMVTDGNDLEHYTDFAERQGVLIEQSDFMPIPVVNGRMLERGSHILLPANHAEIIARSRGNVLEPAADLSELPLFASTEAQEPVEATVLMVVEDKEQETALTVAEKSHKEMKLPHKLTNQFQEKAIAIRGRIGNQWGLAGTMLSGGLEIVTFGTAGTLSYLAVAVGGEALTLLFPAAIAGGFGVIGGGMFLAASSGFIDDQKYRRRAIERNIRKIDKYAAKLPDGDMKDAFNCFAAKTSVAYRTLCYRHSARKLEEAKREGMSEKKWAYKKLKKHAASDEAALERDLDKRGIPEEHKRFVWMLARNNLLDRSVDEDLYHEVKVVSVQQLENEIRKHHGEAVDTLKQASPQMSFLQLPTP
jgi:hypothetical protein